MPGLCLNYVEIVLKKTLKCAFLRDENIVIFIITFDLPIHRNNNSTQRYDLMKRNSNHAILFSFQYIIMWG